MVPLILGGAALIAASYAAYKAGNNKGYSSGYSSGFSKGHSAGYKAATRLGMWSGGGILVAGFVKGIVEFFGSKLASEIWEYLVWLLS